MTFPVTQLGRFGSYCKDLLQASDHRGRDHAPDIVAALALAADAEIARPTLHDVLESKGFMLRSDEKWRAWVLRFQAIVRESQLPLLREYFPCPSPVPRVPRECCPHALTPPSRFGTLRGEFLGTAGDNVYWRTDGKSDIVKFQQPTRIFVILEDGEILLGIEEQNWFKHPSLAAGRPVWSAGEFGSSGGILCVINLASGHYVRYREMPLDQKPREALTQSIFEAYCSHFGVQLHEEFWVSSMGA